MSGTYIADPTDTSGYNNDKTGVSFVTFDSTSGSSGSPTPRIFVGVATNTSSNLFVSHDAGSTCKYIFPEGPRRSFRRSYRVYHSWNEFILDASQGYSLPC
jgi:hypothetical protein